MQLENEQEIIEKSKSNPDSYGLLFDRYYAPIFTYVLHRVGDVCIAQEITSETFLKAYQNIAKFTWQGYSISTWFYKIATNEIRMFYRKQKYSPVSMNALIEKYGCDYRSGEDITKELEDTQTSIEKNKQYLDAQKILQTMSIKYQEVITLRFIGNKKISEIALILNKKEGTVKSLISRGLEKIRDQMQRSGFGSIVNVEELKLKVGVNDG